MRHVPRILAIGLALGAFTAASAGVGRAQVAEAAEAEDPLKNPDQRNVTRTYAIHDLLLDAPRFADPAGSSDADWCATCRGGSVFASAEDYDNDASKRCEDLITRIREHAGTKAQWDDSIFVISSHERSLVVSAPEPVQAQIKALLEAVRAEKRVGIAFQARVLRLSSAEVERLADKTGGTLELDAAMVKELMAKASEEDSGIRVMAAARSRCANGQRMWMFGGGQKGVVAGGPAAASTAKTVQENRTIREAKDGKETTESKTTSGPAGEKPAGGALPTIDMLRHGFLCDLEGAVSDDRRLVHATLRCSYAPLTAVRQADPVGGVHAEAPAFGLFQWRSTVAIPAGGAVLLSAGSVSEQDEDGAETLLLLQATVVGAGR